MKLRNLIMASLVAVGMMPAGAQVKARLQRHPTLKKYSAIQLFSHNGGDYGNAPRGWRRKQSVSRHRENQRRQRRNAHK